MLQVGKLIARCTWILVIGVAAVETPQGRATIRLEIDTFVTNILVLQFITDMKRCCKLQTKPEAECACSIDAVTYCWNNKNSCQISNGYNKN